MLVRQTLQHLRPVSAANLLLSEANALAIGLTQDVSSVFLEKETRHGYIAHRRQSVLRQCSFGLRPVELFAPLPLKS